jgi:hypothetical protein
MGERGLNRVFEKLYRLKPYTSNLVLVIPSWNIYDNGIREKLRQVVTSSCQTQNSKNFNYHLFQK